ncbi:MAG: hypothetical protein FWF00_03075 [Endomicrobia bacterium]|nr:hypothetical protein [Endomicrobiia bacterium]MCL2506658.1 hypothetical protein [Endomicrobiia bacterium]
MKKIVLLMFSILIGLSACATVPKPSKEAQSAAVTFYFSGNGLSALTFWRKINDDGSKGKRFSVGGASKASLLMNGGFKKPFEETIDLEAGTYYLDSFQISAKDGFIVSQIGHYLSRNGWDDAENKPKYLSFTVEGGKDLVLPKVEIIPVRKDKKSIVCRFKITPDDTDVFTIGTFVAEE